MLSVMVTETALLPKVVFVGLERLTVKDSLDSITSSLVIGMVKVPEVDPAAMVKVPLDAV